MTKSAVSCIALCSLLTRPLLAAKLHPGRTYYYRKHVDLGRLIDVCSMTVSAARDGACELCTRCSAPYFTCVVHCSWKQCPTTTKYVQYLRLVVPGLSSLSKMLDCTVQFPLSTARAIRFQLNALSFAGPLNSCQLLYEEKRIQECCS